MKTLSCACLLVTLLTTVQAQDLLKDPKNLEAVNVVVDQTTYKGKVAMRVIETTRSAGETLAILRDFEFTNGTIELEPQPLYDREPTQPPGGLWVWHSA